VSTKVVDALAWMDGIAGDGKWGVGREVIYFMFTSTWQVIKEVRFRGREGVAKVLALGDLVFCIFSEVANSVGNTDRRL
jgi:hypothetical protein